MTVLVQDFLRNGGTQGDLLDRYAIVAKRHRKYDNLVLFKYSQIDSPFAEPLVRECRGIILDEADGWRVISRAFDKFFNHGEGHAAKVDWATARVQEKLDGSLAVMYPYDGNWHVATSGTPDASGEVNGFGLTFAELFWRTFDAQELRLPPLHLGLCFFFELMGPLNRIVVRHPHERLTLLGARYLPTQEEISAAEVALHLPGIGPCHIVREFALQSFEQIAYTFATMSPLSQEGYVVVDAAFNRVKVKHPGYVALHHMKGGTSRKTFVEIVRSGESEEVVDAFPEFKPLLEETRAAYERLIADVKGDYERLCGIEQQKAFAIEAVKTRCSAALFAVRAGKAQGVRAFLRDARIDMVMGLLGYKVEAEIQEAA